MAGFKARELDVLVATTVIEVGVDVPNATIMIVQEADRFGLAQLHQLRGRVGRGAEQSYCLLVSRAKEELSETAAERLEAMVATTDGFELAERDLEIRGEGQLLGARQSGYSDLRFVRLRARSGRCSSERATLAALAPGTRASSPTPSTVSRRGRAPRRLVRIVAGSRKGHRIAAPKGAVTRPTGDRVREAMFSLIGPVEERACSTSSRARARWASRRCRAAPRAASSSSAIATPRASIQANLEKLRLTGAVIVAAMSPPRSARSVTRGRRYDLVLADPPYEEWQRHAPALAELLPLVLADDGLVVVETSERVEPAASARPRHDAGATVPRGSRCSHVITAICPGCTTPSRTATSTSSGVRPRSSTASSSASCATHHKQTLFTVEERVAFLEDALASTRQRRRRRLLRARRRVRTQARGTTMVKGLRVISDFEWEFQMNHLNRQLAPDIETLYVMANPLYSFVSSSGVKEIASFGGRVDELVPAAVAAVSGSSTRTERGAPSPLRVVDFPTHGRTRAHRQARRPRAQREGRAAHRPGSPRPRGDLRDPRSDAGDDPGGDQAGPLDRQGAAGDARRGQAGVRPDHPGRA